MTQAKTDRRRRARKPTPAALIDQLGALRDQRLAKQKEVDELKKREAELEERILQRFTADELAGVKTDAYAASRSTRVIPTVSDWDTFWRHVLETGDSSLIQRRVGQKAVQERWEDGREVPGVEPFTQVSLSLRRR